MVYGSFENIINLSNFLLVLVSIILISVLFVSALQIKKHSKRMGWFVTAVCVTMGGLAYQVAAEGCPVEKKEWYIACSRFIFSLVAPLFSLYFIETEIEEGHDWDGRFWAMLQGLVAVLVSILTVFSGVSFFIHIVVIIQYIIVLVMLLISSKDIKDSIGFIIGVCFPINASLMGLIDSDFNYLGFGITMLLIIVYFGYQVDVERTLLNNQVELSEKKVSLLMDQIHPHFIYNSLQQIALLCDEDVDKIKPAIYNFSGYLRKNFEALTNDGMIPFEREMEHVDMFIALAEILPSRKFVVNKNFEVTDFEIPALCLQPLVENAINYGIGMSSEGNQILIETRKEGGYTIVRVADDGHGKKTQLSTQKKHKSVGTDNIKARLKILCDGELTINKTSHGTESVIKIPDK